MCTVWGIIEVPFLAAMHHILEFQVNKPSQHCPWGWSKFKSLGNTKWRSTLSPSFLVLIIQSLGYPISTHGDKTWFFWNFDPVSQLVPKNGAKKWATASINRQDEKDIGQIYQWLASTLRKDLISSENVLWYMYIVLK